MLLKKHILQKIKISILIFLCVFSFIYFNCLNTGFDTYAAEDESINENELDEAIDNNDEENELDITTKIYKSTDQSADILDNEFNGYSPVQENIISNDELLGKLKPKKKLNSYGKKYKKPASIKQILMPWIVLFFVVLVMLLIFKILKIKKL